MSTHYKDYYGTHMPFGQFPKFGVLSSVKVLMTGTNIAGPFAASIMAEMGAQVIQVEAPNMPCQTRGNYGYSQDHRNTYSITLNTRTAKGKEVLEKLIAWADIWIESGRPGTYAKNGLSDEHMWKINRKLAIVHVSGSNCRVGCISVSAFLSCPASRPRESPWRCRGRSRAAHSKTRSGRCAPRRRG